MVSESESCVLCDQLRPPWSSTAGQPDQLAAVALRLRETRLDEA